MDSKKKTSCFPGQPSGRTPDLAQVLDAAEGNWREIHRALAPALSKALDRIGHHGPCPVHGGKDGFRFFPDAPQAGGGICNTCGTFSNGIKLLEWANNWSRKEALEAVRGWLGRNKRVPTATPPSLADTSINLQAKRCLDAITEEAQKDPGMIRKYLESRGLSGNIPTVVRFHPNLAAYQDRKLLGHYPAMVAPFQAVDGELLAYQRLYLALDGSGKAHIDTPRKNSPAIRKGCLNCAAIRLGPAGEVLGVAEGLETALAIQESTQMSVWAAGSAQAMAKFVPPQVSTTIYIWADHDINETGQQAALKLAERLVLEGRTVYLAIPPKPGYDWLDVLNEDGPDAILRAMEEADECLPDEDHPQAEQDPSREKEAQDIVDDLNHRHFVVNVGGKVCIANLTYDPQMQREDLTLSTVGDFKLRYSNKFYGEEHTYATLWLSHERRRQYAGIVFLPNQEVAGYYNLFRGFPVKPIPGNCELYWEHVRNHICGGNEEHFTFLKRWMAHGIQHPDQLPGTAVVLRGLQGTGKGVFVENFGALFGPHYISIYRLDQVTGRFNSHIKNVLLLHANEACCRGDKIGEGVLKGLITDPFVPVEHKGKDIISLRNYKRILISTNEDWAVPMGMDDRRYLVLDVDPAKKENKEYFGAIAKQMANGGLQALMHDLLSEDLTGFDVRTVPYSINNFAQKLHSAPPIIQWWYDCLCEGRNAGDDASLPGGWNQEPGHDQLFLEYISWCKASQMMTQSKPIFGRIFRKLLPGVTVGESRRLIPSGFDGREKQTIRQRCYLLPDLQACREAFQRFAKAGPEIWPEDDLV